MKNPFASVPGLAAVALLTAGCEGDDAFTPAAASASEPTVGVRFLHASPDAPSVDVVGPGATFAEDLDYKEATALTPFALGAASVSVDANVPGGPLTVIGPAELELIDDTVYSVLAVGPVAALDALIVTAPEADLAAGSVRAQVVHAAPQAPAVDVYVTEPDAVLEQQNPIGSFAFGEVLDPVEVPAGDYQIRVTASGDPAAVVFDSGPVPLAAGADLLLVAVENTGPGDAPISLVAADAEGSVEILDVSTPAEVRAIHASPDAPPVDVIVNEDFENPVLTDVPYAGVSDYLAVAPGTYNIKVTPADNPGVIALDADLELTAGARYSVYASGPLAALEPYVLVDDDRPVATQAKVRLVHLAPGAGLVDIYVTAPGEDISGLDPAFPDVDFGDETGYVPLAGGEYEVTVTAAGTTAPAIGPLTIQVSDGGVYTAAARDAEGGGAPFDLILLDDFTP